MTIERKRVTPEQGGPSLTKQAHALESDVNRIVSRYRQTGVWQRNGLPPLYGDFSDVPELRECLDRIREMEEDFAHLPAAVKMAASQDPTKFLEMVVDPERRKVLEAAGWVQDRHGPTDPKQAPPDPGSSVISPTEPPTE